ncbi:RluA family pseudouridine synthase [Paenisporosarcina cavernae]|uniref:Pseudouridine synthase n=1 Tax=Paenisporosarcina cavernae TaxID=2320858 RepID=A0A385YSR6_9BACL|nr:RluA family pseudouridine synthase [Paenisporosarcina cavernae]AYC29027.1 RluA family pseudouridine synthase [Paenisporosarcina cavernae]
MKLRYTAPQEMLVKEAITALGISKRALTAIKYEGGSILVNGEEKTVRHVLQKADVVTVLFPKEVPSEGIPLEHGPIEIVYEDPYLLIINKPANQRSIPSIDAPNGSLASQVLGYYNRQGIEATIHIVTRLDRDTTGLVCLAKHRHIHFLLGNQTLHKEYRAFISGEMTTNRQITLPIGRKDGSIIERTVREDGQYARTDIEIVERHASWTDITCTLRTGRTHQIRVHLSAIGHALIGDELYGGPTEHVRRQALHCQRLQFTHPITGELLKITSELPADMLHFKHYHG